MALTWGIRSYALRTGMVDEAGMRTLHSGRVPRGGGLAIVLVMMAALVALHGQGTAVTPLLTAVAAFAVLGWLDDRHDLSPLLRIVCQLAAAAILVAWLGYYTTIELAGWSIQLGWSGPLFTVLWITWLGNAYNFMDGIDGIAAGQAAAAALTMGVWFATAGNDVLALFCYVIMAASLGFLAWNWSPARIFMGDVGSVTLGALFAILALIAYQYNDMPVGAFVLLLGVFVADSTITLARRALRGERVWQAHREHYYQQAAAIWGHARVTTAAIGLSLLLAILGTLEAHRLPPRPLWYLLAAALLAAAVWVIRRAGHRHHNHL